MEGNTAVKFEPIEQEESEYNTGWRFGVMVGSALLLLGLAICMIGVSL